MIKFKNREMIMAVVALLTAVFVLSTKVNAETQSTLEDRITKYKTENIVNINSAQKAKILTACKSAQSKLAAVTAKTELLSTTTTKVQTSTKAYISTIKVNPDNQAVFDAAEIAVQNAYIAMTQSSELLRQSLDDASKIECTTDPEAFTASLVFARKQLAKANSDYVKGIASIRQKLKSLDN
jgi:hypothetical protein